MIEAASAYIEDGGKILTIEREGGKFLGYRSMPHGMVEKGDTPELTAIKETEEESGYKVEVIKQITDYIGQFESGEKVKIYVFKCKIIGGKEMPDMNPQWIDKKELLNRDDVVPSLTKAIETIISNKS